MRRTLVIASVVTAFLAAGLAPAVLAHDSGPDGQADKEDRKEAKQQAKEERKEQKEEEKEERKEAKEQAKEERKEAKEQAKEERKAMKEEGKEARKEMRDLKPKYVPGNVTLRLAGEGLAPDNGTYSIEVTASGKALERVKAYRDDGRVRYQARLVAHVVVKDANGTVVQEGDLRVRLFAHGDGNQTKWALKSHGGPDGLPKVFLKGEAVKSGPGAWDLSGRGHAVLQAGEPDEPDREKLPLRIPRVAGTFERVLPAAPAAD